LRFHRATPRDSYPVVTPFVRVGIYPTRNFALLFQLRRAISSSNTEILEHGVWSLVSREPDNIPVTRYEGSFFYGVWMFCLSHSITVPVLSYTTYDVRNLRTIIVIADIDQGLQRPAYHPKITYQHCLTFWHWSGVTPYTSSYEFAGSCVFGKQSPGILSLRPPSCPGGRPYP
jgi:hypothetical protein